MKAVLFLVSLMICCSFAPAETEPFKFTLPVIAALLAGIWEVVGRIIPSVGQITIIGKVIEILSWISNFLNHSKK
jgi:hypothetical protein